MLLFIDEVNAMKEERFAVTPEGVELYRPVPENKRDESVFNARRTRVANFMAEMIMKYGWDVLAEIEAEESNR